MNAHAVIFRETLIPQVLLHPDKMEQRLKLLRLGEAPIRRMLPLTQSALIISLHRTFKYRRERIRTHWTMLNMETLSLTSKHRNTASHAMYDSRSTVFRSGAPEVS